MVKLVVCRKRTMTRTDGRVMSAENSAAAAGALSSPREGVDCNMIVCKTSIQVSKNINFVASLSLELHQLGQSEHP